MLQNVLSNFCNTKKVCVLIYSRWVNKKSCLQEVHSKPVYQWNQHTDALNYIQTELHETVNITGTAKYVCKSRYKRYLSKRLFETDLI